MAERMVHATRKKSEEELDDTLLLEENIIDNPTPSGTNVEISKTGAAGKKKNDPGSQNLCRSSISIKPLSQSQRGNKRKTTLEVEADIEIAGPSQTQAINNSQSNHDPIMGVLKSIHDSQKKQGDEIEYLSNRLQTIEHDGYDEEQYDDYSSQDEDDQDHPETDHEPPAKKQKSSDSNNNISKFSSLSKRRKQQKVWDAKIDDFLAENVTDLFRNGMNEEQFSELTKDDNNARPENCEGLTVVRTNQLIWNVISAPAQTADKKLQLIEKSVVKAVTILTKTVNKMASVAGVDGLTCDDEQLDNCNDVLALLGHSNRQINLTRREFLKPELMSEYLHLCSQSVPYTNYLFGDDVFKAAKDIEDCSKVGNKIRFGRGRGGGYRGGRSGHRGKVGHRGSGCGRGRGSSGYKNGSKQVPKNLQRGGSSQSHQKDNR